MSGAVNNGHAIGSVYVLVQTTPRKRKPFQVAWDTALSLLTQAEVETTDWLVSVHRDDTGEVLGTKQFDSRPRADRARADLIAVAGSAGNLDDFDWAGNLART